MAQKFVKCIPVGYKVILHSHQILKINETCIITFCSPSGDTDIVVLTVALLYEFRNRVLQVTVLRPTERLCNDATWTFEKDLVDALISSFHAFTENDYISLFFRKGKEKSCKLVEKTKKFQNPFSIPGKNWEVSYNDLFIMLEELVCQHCGY